jgi:hypothetical protein
MEQKVPVRPGQALRVATRTARDVCQPADTMGGSEATTGPNAYGRAFLHN